MLIQVDDSDKLQRDDEIGGFTFEVATLWRQQGFSEDDGGGAMLEKGLYRRWVGLVDSTGEHEGVQGYVLVSVLLLHEGDDLGASLKKSPSGATGQVSDVLVRSPQPARATLRIVLHRTHQDGLAVLLSLPAARTCRCRLPWKWRAFS